MTTAALLIAGILTGLFVALTLLECLTPNVGEHILPDASQLDDLDRARADVDAWLDFPDTYGEYRRKP